LILSHKKRFIFIHVYKTAGTSITKLLIPYARATEKFTRHYFVSRKIFTILNILRKKDDGGAWINGVHKHAPAETIREFVGNTIWNEYYKFGFVRNPYAWILSTYFEILKDKNNTHFKNVKDMKFQNFLSYYIKNKLPRQVDFYLVNGAIDIDFIGRFENLDLDIPKALKAINIECNLIPKLNTGERQRLEDFFDKDAEEKTYNYFEDDFINFNYPRISF